MRAEQNKNEKNSIVVWQESHNTCTLSDVQSEYVLKFYIQLFKATELSLQQTSVLLCPGFSSTMTLSTFLNKVKVFICCVGTLLTGIFQICYIFYFRSSVDIKPYVINYRTDDLCWRKQNKCLLEKAAKKLKEPNIAWLKLLTQVQLHPCKLF